MMGALFANIRRSTVALLTKSWARQAGTFFLAGGVAFTACAEDNPAERPSTELPESSGGMLAPATGGSVGFVAETGGLGGQGGTLVEPEFVPRWPSRQAAFSDRFGGRLLGATMYSESEVEFAIFAPNASSATVEGDFGSVPLVQDAAGVFSAVVDLPNAAGKQYGFALDGKNVSDPYAKAFAYADGPSLVVDYYRESSSFARKSRNELVVYEMHAGNFTLDPTSGVSDDKRGKFSGFSEKLAYLKRLGVNAVELMPVTANQSNGYSWGYNPAYFFAPDAELASQSGVNAVRELGDLVSVLHEAGIAVILDVVYNHVSGQDKNPYWNIDAGYYFDVDSDGDVNDDATDWGYRLATNKPMVQKLMFDNMKYLMDAFRVDGFRLDSTENMDIDATIEVVRALRDAGYGDRTYIFEEFSGAHNEQIRAENALAESPYISSWGTGYKNHVWSALTSGSCQCVSLGNSTFYSQNIGYSGPLEVVNFFSSHDEGTLTGHLGASQAQVRTAAVHLLTSLGVPMLWMGEEFARVHYGNHHPGGGTLHLSEEANRMDWSLVTQNSALVDVFSALIGLRVRHPALHADSDSFFSWSPPVNADWERSIGYRYAGTPTDNDFVVLVNYAQTSAHYDVLFPSAGTWHVMYDGTAASGDLPGLSQLVVDTAPVPITLPAQSARIFMSEAENP